MLTAEPAYSGHLWLHMGKLFPNDLIKQVATFGRTLLLQWQVRCTSVLALAQRTTYHIKF